MESTAETWELCSSNWKLRRVISDCMLLDHCIEKPDNRWELCDYLWLKDEEASDDIIKLAE